VLLMLLLVLRRRCVLEPCRRSEAERDSTTHGRRHAAAAIAVDDGRCHDGRLGEELRRERLHGELDVVLAGLGGEFALGIVAVALALAVLLVRVLDRDGLVHQVLAVHVLDRLVRGLEVGEGYKAVALGQIAVVPRDLEIS
jgi:hypothetical protein